MASIRAAELVVAVLPKSGGVRDNLMYEIGLAVGSGRRILLVASDGVSVPSALKDFLIWRRRGEALLDANNVAAAVLQTLGSREPIDADSGFVADELRQAAEDPTVLEAMPGRRLEELVSRWMIEHGLAVAEGGPDRGYDLVLRDPKGQTTSLVEVKKSPLDGRVSVETVAQLSAAMSAYGAIAGILVATAPLTGAALSMAAASKIVSLTVAELVRMGRNELLALVAGKGEKSERS
jgi:hypothetical protein